MYLLIPAAGSGRRMGSDRNKLLLTLHDQPLLAWTLLAAEAATAISWIGVIGQPYDFDDFQNIIKSLALSKPVELIPGGDTRQISVSNGLDALPAMAERVLIHDGARCLATPSLFNNCAQALQTCQGLIAAIPVKDTIKIVDKDHFILDTPDRSQLWAAQTPQGFEVQLLKECHQRGKQEGWEVTDDAALLEKCGVPVKIVPGEETNLKVTTPMDLAIADFILSQRKKEQKQQMIAELMTKNIIVNSEESYDSLTKLLHRRYGEEYLNSTINLAQQQGQFLGVILLDVDRFKNINNFYSHLGGDIVLQSLATFLKEMVDIPNLVCRWQSDKMLMIFPGFTITETVTKAESIRSAIASRSFYYDSQIITGITVSMGVACFPEHGTSSDSLIESAYLALHSAKSNGRNRVMIRVE